MKNENKICLYAHVEIEPYGGELCCEKYYGYCIFSRRNPDIDYSKCERAKLVMPKTWAKHWKWPLK